MRRAALIAAIALALGGCGGGDGDVSGRAKEALQPHVDEVRLAAANRNAGQLRTDLQELRGAVDVLEAEGELSEAGATRIRRQADVVEQQTASITTTTTAAPRRTAPSGVVRGRVEEKPTKGKDDDEGKRKAAEAVGGEGGD